METLDIGGAMSREKILALIDIIGIDATKDILSHANATEKEAMAMGIAYKAAAQPPDMATLVAQLEDLAQRLDDLLTQLDGVQASAPVPELKRVDYGQVHTASPTGLTKRKSFDPRTDFQARALGADQARRPQ